MTNGHPGWKIVNSWEFWGQAEVYHTWTHSAIQLTTYLFLMNFSLAGEVSLERPSNIPIFSRPQWSLRHFQTTLGGPLYLWARDKNGKPTVYECIALTYAVQQLAIQHSSLAACSHEVVSHFWTSDIKGQIYYVAYYCITLTWAIQQLTKEHAPLTAHF